MSSSNVFALLDELDKESGMKNPYQLYYHLSTTPSDFSKYNDEGFNVFTWALSQYSKDIFDILDDIYNISVANGKVPDDIINNLDKNGNNIFSIVLRINPVEKRHKTLNMLLQKNFDQEMRDGSDDTPLHIAARRNDLYSIFLLTHNTFISINTVGKNNRTPIYYAIKNQNEIKEWILNHNLLEKLKNDLKNFEKQNFELGWNERLEFIKEEKDILSKEEIDRIPLVLPNTFLINEEDKRCSICFDGYKDDKPVRKLDCQHHFHMECNDKWMAINDSCPICRRKIIRDI